MSYNILAPAIKFTLCITTTLLLLFNSTTTAKPNEYGSKILLSINEKNTLHKMLGQMIILGFKGTSIRDRNVKSIMQHIKKREIGGVIIETHNVLNPKQLKHLNRAILNTKSKSKHNLPTIIAVERDGGKFGCLSQKKGFKVYPRPYNMTKLTASKARRIYVHMSKNTKSLGFNMLLGPSLNISKKSDILNPHSTMFSKNINTIVTYATEFIKAHKHNGLITSVKYFPGQKYLNYSASDDDADIITNWEEVEITPFKKIINSNLSDSVMIGHTYNREVDEKRPSPLSHKTVHQLLKKQLKYKGVIVSDNLNKHIISKYCAPEKAAIQSILAGSDIIILAQQQSNKKGKHLNKTKNIPNAIWKETLSILQKRNTQALFLKQRIIESYNKISKLKKKVLIAM
ncbi:glycoside hydrolase family 3 N-terminal domain-containing protein [Candidatus Sneabacter namystus]|uniref:beta-N-acetylhexosaminidase n=1 Tax=Candidatus Sneabacter namystus TaxID=2601646 RepID=A0A5C0UI13_9RICK|nr:glycoside hydrolase family 3 N-terminal domain-containing protein [Candidatus Sneabacter namystus]QEK39380.1 hypothetical protein FZC37_00255 [Candidatus Sneabacter namystus]